MVEEHKKREVRRKKVMYGRLHVLWFSIFIIFVLLILKISVVQLVEGDQYLKAAQNNNVKELPVMAPRGVIYDRSGEPLVTNEPIFAAMYIETSDPDEVKIDTAKRLAELLGEDPAEVLEAMDVSLNLKGDDLDNRKQPRYMPKKIKAGLTEEQVSKIRERPQDYPGVNVVYEPKRIYRDDTFASQTIGYVRSFSGAQDLKQYKELSEEEKEAYLDWEQVGYDGIEYSYDQYLRGKHGSQTVRVDSLMRIEEELEQTNPEIGHSLYLNLDEKVQLEAEKFIEEHLHKLRCCMPSRHRAPNAKNAYAVMMEVKTGKVRAMISYPDYDPNVWKESIKGDYITEELNFVTNNGTIRNAPPDVRGASDLDEAVKYHPQSLLPMGSAYKPLNILIMLNEGVIDPWSGYYDTGRFEYARDTPPVRNDGGRGNGYLNPKTAIMRSSNTYMAWAANQLYRNTGGESGNSLEIMSEYNKQFGLFTKTGVDLPKESEGQEEYFDVAEKVSVQGALIQASFGQYQRPTAIQMAQFAATIANDGVRMQPQLVDRIVDAEGKVVKEIEPKVMSKADNIKQEYLNVVKEGMTLVTSSRGTGRDLFKNLPHRTAAKTGTSEQLVKGPKRIENAVMVAYYPAHDPQVAVSVVVPEGGYGSQGAGPIAEKLLELYQAEFMDEDNK